ncbi:hypothetical protein A2Y99_01705 [Candidatus Gottesmanbacteria bacterium RBG_13_37_7]|uniref:Uncharacterized protein n=1 Tax=Candidatus Gottesmanbacteria bacterium RBG_13_37_7 TaxID=1798369 RepID=A0A1F5YI56_9BACT|nr:MAG: hypothetical protein A2Y99_01705 [Candidatus Gottesmanbacteria bacterium RBG_13_37_7]
MKSAEESLADIEELRSRARNWVRASVPGALLLTGDIAANIANGNFGRIIHAIRDGGSIPGDLGPLTLSVAGLIFVTHVPLKRGELTMIRIKEKVAALRASFPDAPFPDDRLTLSEKLLDRLTR